MELALRETVKLPSTRNLDLDGLITAAGLTKILEPAHLQMAREVQRTGNQVVHRQPCTDDQALDTIVNVRAVVEQLYRPAPPEEHS